MTELDDLKKQIAEMKFASDPEKAMCKLSNYLHLLQRVDALERTAQHWSRMVNDELNSEFAFMEHDKIPDSPPARRFKDSLESRQPAPEPGQRVRWEAIDGDGLYYGDGQIDDVDIATLLNAHGITPDSKTIDREKGRELVKDWDNEKPHNKNRIGYSLRDWIAEVCGEDK